jgi:hypothetical protein
MMRINAMRTNAMQINAMRINAMRINAMQINAMRTNAMQRVVRKYHYYANVELNDCTKCVHYVAPKELSDKYWWVQDQKVGRCSLFNYRNVANSRTDDGLCGYKGRFYEPLQPKDAIKKDADTDKDADKKDVICNDSYKKYEMVDDCTRFFPVGSIIRAEPHNH